MEEFLAEGLGAVFVRTGLGRGIRGGNAQVSQLVVTTLQASDDLPEAMGRARMSEEHAEELAQQVNPRACRSVRVFWIAC